jgi:hypothetical protein
MSLKEYFHVWLLLLAILLPVPAIIWISAIILEILIGYQDWILSLIKTTTAIFFSVLLISLIAFVVLVIVAIINYIRR